MKVLIAAALLGATAVGGVAVAAQTTAPAQKPLKADGNGDGRVTRAEFLSDAATRFAAIDANRDGAITADEQRMGHGPRHGRRFAPIGAQDGPPPPPGAGGRGAGVPGMGRPGMGGPGRMLQRLDTDGDGRISKAEFARQAADRFARMDTNGNGTVEATEMAAAPGGGRGMMRRDGDGNGTLTRAEFDKQTAERFARMDTNGDGFIDAKEQAAVGTMRGGGRRGGPGAPPTRPAAAPATPPTGA